jgi:hypothetical protein
MRAIAFASASAIVLAACGAAPSPTGAGEPLAVAGARFLPGNPTSGGNGDASITGVDLPTGRVTVGQANVPVTGRASASAYAVALRLEGLGSGVWIVPVEGADVAAPGELTWRANLDVGFAAPPGLQALEVFAVDEAGRASAPKRFPLCVAPRVPDGGNACDPSAKPPHTVVTLTWSNGADVDLRVKTDDGRWLSGKNPTTAAPVDGRIPADAIASPTTGRFTRDSLAACVDDGWRQEDLVFEEAPASGTFLLHAALFAPCGAGTVHARLVVRRRTQGDGGSFAQQIVEEKTFDLLPASAHGPDTPPLYLTALTFTGQD